MQNIIITRDGALQRRVVRNNFLCRNECYETTSTDEEI